MRAARGHRDNATSGVWVLSFFLPGRSPSSSVITRTAARSLFVAGVGNLDQTRAARARSAR